jgi:TonB family protein
VEDEMRLLSMIPLSVMMITLGCSHQSNSKNIEAKQSPILPVQKSSDSGCDFSAYQPVRQSHFVSNTVIEKVKPEYPPEARKRGAQGWINVKILVNRDGAVEKACADGDQTLKDAAEKAALQWKFKPNFGYAKAAEAGSRKYKYREDVIAFNFVLGEK